LHLRRHAVGIALPGARRGVEDERLLRARRIAGRLVGIVVAELVEREAEPIGHATDSATAWMLAEKPRHLGS
jgi:hypothetical protein